MTSKRFVTWLISMIVLPLVAVACRSPQVQKQRHLERGNQYVAEHRDDFAVIEYATAVRIDPKFGEARLRLAETYEHMNNFRAAFPEYVRAADALPDNRDAQIKAIQILLVARRFDDAKARAAVLVSKNPKDLDAILLHANALASLKDPEGAIAEIEDALKIDPDNSRALVNLGAVQTSGGDSAKAEDSFKKAIALDPNSANAHLAYANFLWSAGRQPEAENQIKRVLADDPRHVLSNRMLGALYLASNRAAEAEQPLKVVAEASGAPAAKFQLAQYYLTIKRGNEATALLTQLAADPASAADAETMLASIDYAAGRHSEAHARLDKLIARSPKDARALSLKARWLAAEGDLDGALERANAAIAADAQSAEAHFVAAMVHDVRREPNEAIQSYTEVLRLNPRASAAQIRLSRLSLMTGNSNAALQYAQAAKQSAPSSEAAGVALVGSLMASGDLARADSELATLLREHANSADVQALNGALQLRHNNRAAAAAAYERALQFDPGNVEAISGVVGLDVRDKNYPSAIRRLDAALLKQPNQVDLLGLAAQVYTQAGQNDKAEDALRRAVTANPRFSNGYAMLAALYLKEQRLDEARREFEAMAKRDPRAAGPRTMVGMIMEAQGKRDDAKRWYEATVAEMNNVPVVANNLAYIYAEQGVNLDVALQLAKTAKQQMPDNPDVDDTLGWVYYKKDLATLGVRSLEDSLAKKPNDAVVLYHLGLTYAKLGDNDKARTALTQALSVNPQLDGAETARRTLAAVSQR
jgi:tetratricopeptide (TPR) repeat protein